RICRIRRRKAARSMSSRSREYGTILWIGLIFGMLMFIVDSVNGAERVLRVCADPNNLPFSNERGEGFENKLAELAAGELGAKINYTWWAQRRGFVRNTLREGLCDVVVGVPVGFDPLLTTQPYYRSTYVFVTRRDRGLALKSLDDPRLRSLRIGVHLIGNDGFNVPPAHGLARRGMVTNVVGYTIYGDYRDPNPPALHYFFAIAMGVRKGDSVLRDELNAFLDKRHAQIQSILKDYGVPQVDAE